MIMITFYMFIFHDKLFISISKASKLIYEKVIGLDKLLYRGIIIIFVDIANYKMEDELKELMSYLKI